MIIGVIIVRCVSRKNGWRTGSDPSKDSQNGSGDQRYVGMFRLTSDFRGLLVLGKY